MERFFPSDILIIQLPTLLHQTWARWVNTATILVEIADPDYCGIATVTHVIAHIRSYGFQSSTQFVLN